MSDNINKQDNRGQTDLMKACWGADIALIEQILELKPDVNLTNSVGQTALFYVVVGTGINDTIAQIAERVHDRVKIIKLLHSHSIDINHRDNNGNTALMSAVYFYKMCDCLLKLGAKSHYRNNKKESALFNACQSLKKKSMRLLCESDNSWIHIQRCLIEIKNVNTGNGALAINILEKMKFDLPIIEFNNKLNEDLTQTVKTKSIKI